MDQANGKHLLIKLGMVIIALNGLQPVAATTRQQAEQLLPGWLTHTGTPSAAVAFIQQGKVQWTLVTGEQSPGVPANEATLYNVASLAKPVTAELLLRLSNQQPALLQQKAANYWEDPDLAGHEFLHKLTIRHLLAHQSGLPNWRYQTNDKLTFIFEPGSRSGYSGEGYQYLAKLMQNKWQTPFEKLMQQQLFVPLGMHSTAFTKQAWFDGRLAYPKGPEGAYGEPVLRDEFVAADDLYASIGDYGRFVASVMAGKGLAEPLASQRWLVDFDLAAGLCQSGRLTNANCPQRLGFAMGWTLIQYEDLSLYMQGGGDWGERSLALMLPASQTGIVVLTNGANGMKVIRNLVNLLLPHPKYDAFLTMQAENQ